MRSYDQTFWLITIVISANVLMVGAFITYEYKHPCVEWQTRSGTCGGGMYCCFMNTDGMCMTWCTEDTYPCSWKECTKRGNR